MGTRIANFGLRSYMSHWQSQTLATQHKFEEGNPRPSYHFTYLDDCLRTTDFQNLSTSTAAIWQCQSHNLSIFGKLKGNNY